MQLSIGSLAPGFAGEGVFIRAGRPSTSANAFSTHNPATNLRVTLREILPSYTPLYRVRIKGVLKTRFKKYSVFLLHFLEMYAFENVCEKGFVGIFKIREVMGV